jgi:hypothetical protein
MQARHAIPEHAIRIETIDAVARDRQRAQGSGGDTGRTGCMFLGCLPCVEHLCHRSPGLDDDDDVAATCRTR